MIRAPGRRLAPLSWSNPDARLHVAVGSYHISSIDVVERRALTEQLPGNWSAVRYAALSHGDGVALLRSRRRDIQQLVQSSEYQTIYVTLAGQELELGGVPRIEPRHLHLLEGGRRSTALLPAALVRTPLILRSPIGRRAVDLGAATEAALRSDSLYRRPAVDLSTGGRVGSFGLSGISYEGSPSHPFQAVFDFLPEPFVVRDLSISGSSIAILFEDAVGNVSVAVQHRGQISTNLVCDSSRAHRTNVAPTPGMPADQVTARETLQGRSMAEIDLAEEGTGSRAMGLLFRRDVGSRDLVVYFHGGPGASSLDEGVTGAFRALALPEADFLLVEYSGSAARGVELVNALRESGPRAIEADAAALGSWLQRQPYRRIHLVGSSFGSVPALAVLANFRNRLCTTSLIAPLLRYQTPDQLRRPGNQADARAAAARALFEYSAMGEGRQIAALSEWLNRRVGLLARPNVHVFFASHDNLSMAEFLPPRFHGGGARHTVIAGTHRSIIRSPELYGAVRNHTRLGCRR